MEEPGKSVPPRNQRVNGINRSVITRAHERRAACGRAGGRRGVERGEKRAKKKPRSMSEMGIFSQPSLRDAANFPVFIDLPYF